MFVISGYFAVTAALDRSGDQPEEEVEHRYLRSEEGVIITPPDLASDEVREDAENIEDTDPTERETKEEILTLDPVLFEYIEVIDSCDHNFEGDCLNVRSGPGEDFPVVDQLRTNVVLKVGGEVERDGRTWYKIVFDEWIRYPERVTSDWYVAADFVDVLLDEGVINISPENKPDPDKRIVVSRSDQTLHAYEDGELFMEEDISTGLELTPTPRGTFTIFRKTPSRYMQGPIPGVSSRHWDLPGVPWNLYFTHQGAVIHGTYWHDDFGSQASAGCVNIVPDRARELYYWAEIGTTVVVRD